MSTRMDEIEKSIEEIVKQKSARVESKIVSVRKAEKSKARKTIDIEVKEPDKKETIETKVEPTKPAETEFIAQDDYSTQTQKFTQFMKNAYNSQFKAITQYSYDTVRFIAPEWEKSSTSYTKIIKNVLMIAANKLMGAPHNYISPSDIEDYKHWKNLNKANRTIARIYAQTSGMPFL